MYIDMDYYMIVTYILHLTNIIVTNEYYVMQV